MSFSEQDLRPGKDVFSADGTYLGTVVWVTLKPLPPNSRFRGEEKQGLGYEHAHPPFSGEAIGPMPTAALGNSGPYRQSSATGYATSSAGTATATRLPTELVVLRLLTSLNWSTLRPRLRRIPVSLVQAVSHERIVVSASPDTDPLG